MTTLSLTEHLEAALERLRRVGMAKNTLRDGDGHECATGVLYYTDQYKAVRAIYFLSEIAREQYPERTQQYDYLVCFNNHPLTTQPELEALFEKGIAKSMELI